MRRCHTRCMLVSHMNQTPQYQNATDRVEVVTGDITTLAVDAIVNAANTTLLGGGGVDGAIHRAAGPQLLEACRALGGCPTGGAKITPGFKLKAKFVIHTVGPVWRDGRANEDALLASCYRQTHQIAHQNNIQTIGFPAISTGVYRFPKERAAKIAWRSTLQWLADNDTPQRVIFCCFSDTDAAVYQAVIASGVADVQ